MKNQIISYNKAKKKIYLKKSNLNKKDDLEEFDKDLLDNSMHKIEFSDVIQVGTKVIIGGSLGLLAGIAAIAVTASAFEVVIAGAVTKIAGIVGSAIGLSLGFHQIKAE